MLVVGMLIFSSAQADKKPKTVDKPAKTHKWKNLIQKNSTAGWHNYLKDTPVGWTVENGVLSSSGSKGSIVSDGIYGDFELVLEWKLEAGGNSGVFYHLVEEPKNDRIHMSGPEYQMIDDYNYPIKITELQKTGALYDLIPPRELVAKPLGQWNTTRIIVKDSKVEHWLNGKKLVEYMLNSPVLEELISYSKFVEFPQFAKSGEGRIGLQDHKDPVYFRNIKIREL